MPVLPLVGPRGICIACLKLSVSFAALRYSARARWTRARCTRRALGAYSASTRCTRRARCVLGALGAYFAHGALCGLCVFSVQVFRQLLGLQLVAPREIGINLHQPVSTLA